MTVYQALMAAATVLFGYVVLRLWVTLALALSAYLVTRSRGLRVT